MVQYKMFLFAWRVFMKYDSMALSFQVISSEGNQIHLSLSMDKSLWNQRPHHLGPENRRFEGIYPA